MLKFGLPLLSALLLATGANAATVAAWDFSQYLSPGFLSTDGVNPATTLNSNYSDLDAVQAPGLGVGSEVFGTLFLDGTAGSTVASFASGFTAAADLTQNNDAVQAVSTVLMGSTAAANLFAFGETPPSQEIVTQVGLQTLTASPVAVFQADASSVFGSANSWELTFAGLSAFGGDSVVTIEVSADGSSFVTLGTETLTGSEGLFNVDLGSTVDGSSTAWVRLSFDDVAGATIDNVSFSAVPEPGVAMLGLLGAIGLARFGRRR